MTLFRSGLALASTNDQDRARLVFLNPGDFHFGAAPLQLATLLGSCVTVTLWHPRRHIGGMCHFLVPNRKTQQDHVPSGYSAVEAFGLFDQAMLHAGSRSHEYQAKLFGGGNMFPNSAGRLNVGLRNIEMARRLLKERGIPLLAEHAGGAGHRKLVFEIASGEVRLVFADLEK
jgi:chemotaxis protein CheD